MAEVKHRKGEWRKCKTCETVMWVFQKDLDTKKYCSRPCLYASRGAWKREGNPNWRGGKTIICGRPAIYLPDHHRANKQGYVYEHIVIAEKILGRPLIYISHSNKDNEVVHHIDENKMNNAPENLFVCLSADHKSYHMKKKRPNNARRHIAQNS